MPRPWFGTGDRTSRGSDVPADLLVPFPGAMVGVARVIEAQVAEQHGEPSACPRAPTLDRSLRYPEHLGDLCHRVPLHVQENKRHPLLGG